MEYQEKLAEKAEREAAMLRVAVGTTPQTVESDDDEDDDFLRAYRERRLRELKRDADKPSFGAFRREVSKEDYLSALDLDPRVVVVVHISEPRLPPCRRLEGLLDVLARRRPDILFISITVDETGQDFDPDVMPVLALYQDGHVVDTLFRVTANLDVATEHDDLECLIDSSAAFQAPPQPLDVPPAGSPPFFSPSAADGA